MSVGRRLVLASLAPAILSAPELKAEPQVSMIVDGVISSYSQDPEGYRLPGFQLGGEAGLHDEGWSFGHNEFAVTSEIADLLEGKFTAVMHQHESALEFELEELWLQTLGLGHGVTLKGGRFFSDLGYLNDRHPHMWDFADAPLVYQGILGSHYKDNGAQASWIAPTDIYLRFGIEAFTGDEFPFDYGGGGIGSWNLFVKSGGDFNTSHSWQFGASYLQGESHSRLGGHAHGHEQHQADSEDAFGGEHGEDAHLPAFSGESKIAIVDFVYKWAPDGNYKERFFKLQMEYLHRREDGRLDLLHDGISEEASAYTGRQQGAYIQGTYRFLPRWQGSLRYDHLSSDNRAVDAEVLEEAGLDSEYSPWRATAAVAWVPNEYTTLRLQYNYDRSLPRTDHQLLVQFIYSFGAHGAHQF